MKTNRVKYPKANLGGVSRKRTIRKRNQAMDRKFKRESMLFYGVVAIAVAAGGYAYWRSRKNKYSDLPQPPADAPIPPMYPQPPIPRP